MPDTAGSQHSWAMPALEELRSNLEYARDLVRGGQFLERLKVGAFDVADLYRAAWVQAVSALDHWVHRELYERALGFALNIEEQRPERFLKLEVPMQLFEDVHHHAGDYREAFEEHLRNKFGYQSFQAPDKIKQALSYVRDNKADLWSEVAKRLQASTGLQTREAVLECLADIVQRRNKIAHEADRDPEDGTSRLAIFAPRRPSDDRPDRACRGRCRRRARTSARGPQSARRRRGHRCGRGVAQTAALPAVLDGVQADRRAARLEHGAASAGELVEHANWCFRHDLGFVLFAIRVPVRAAGSRRSCTVSPSMRRTSGQTFDIGWRTPQARLRAAVAAVGGVPNVSG